MNIKQVQEKLIALISDDGTDYDSLDTAKNNISEENKKILFNNNIGQEGHSYKLSILMIEDKNTSFDTIYDFYKSILLLPGLDETDEKYNQYSEHSLENTHDDYAFNKLTGELPGIIRAIVDRFIL